MPVATPSRTPKAPRATRRYLDDPEVRRAAEAMQQKVMEDPETQRLLEELMRRLGGPPADE